MRTSTTLRVSIELHDRIAQLAKRRGQRMQDIVSQAIDAWERALFWDEFGESVKQLQADPDAWAEELAERKIWEATLKDGLEPEPDVDW